MNENMNVAYSGAQQKHSVERSDAEVLSEIETSIKCKKVRKTANVITSLHLLQLFQHQFSYFCLYYERITTQLCGFSIRSRIFNLTRNQRLRSHNNDKSKVKGGHSKDSLVFLGQCTSHLKPQAWFPNVLGFTPALYTSAPFFLMASCGLSMHSLCLELVISRNSVYK